MNESGEIKERKGKERKRKRIFSQGNSLKRYRGTAEKVLEVYLQTMEPYRLRVNQNPPFSYISFSFFLSLFLFFFSLPLTLSLSIKHCYVVALTNGLTARNCFSSLLFLSTFSLSLSRTAIHLHHFLSFLIIRSQESSFFFFFSVKRPLFLTM